MERHARVRLRGGLVKFWREVAFEVSQGRLAAMCGLRSRQAIANIEKSKPTTVATAEKLVRAFNRLLIADEETRKWRAEPLSLDDLIEDVLTPRPINGEFLTWSCDDPDLTSDLLPRIGELYESLIGREFRSAEALLSPDMRFQILGPSWLPITAVREGRAEVMGTVERNFSLVSHQEVEVVDAVVQGRSVALIARERGSTVETGAPYEVHWSGFYRLDGKKLSSTRILISV